MSLHSSEVSMDMVGARDRINQALKDFTTQVSIIRVLLIYWDVESQNFHNNLTFKDEAYRVHSFFQQKFQYNVEHFAIPVERSYLALSTKISQILLELDGTHSLLVLHYGGHGDADNIDGERRAVWSVYVFEYACGYPC